MIKNLKMSERKRIETREKI
ncbi:hypothetical protein [Nostoc edaphicum]